MFSRFGKASVFPMLPMIEMNYFPCLDRQVLSLETAQKACDLAVQYPEFGMLAPLTDEAYVIIISQCENQLVLLQNACNVVYYKYTSSFAL
jgi:hypothetical protein